MSKKTIDPKTPKWFRAWMTNDYYHMEMKVNGLLWITGVGVACIIGKILLDFFWG